jgi:hypothetical protein
MVAFNTLELLTPEFNGIAKGTGLTWNFIRLGSENIGIFLFFIIAKT